MDEDLVAAGRGGIDLDRAEGFARKSEQQLADELASLDFKSLTDAQVSRMETVAWTWDAFGWIQFKRGNLTQADEYVRAAWLLAGFPNMALHLGQVSQKT